jgi:hypothetical protein
LIKKTASMHLLSALTFLLLATSARSSIIQGRQLAPAETVAPDVTPIVSGEAAVSTDMAKLNNATADYYLGYKEADFQLPYAKYLQSDSPI